MQDKIGVLRKEIEACRLASGQESEVALFRNRYLARKGKIGELFAQLGSVPPEGRKEVGMALQQLRALAEAKLAALQADMQGQQAAPAAEDLTRPPVPYPLGASHPLTLLRARIIALLQPLGFEVTEGAEIEDDWHNFTALNFPEHHPARQMQDTFFLDKEKEWLLRTHTSSVQIRKLAGQSLPIKVVAIGRVYRNEAISARSHCMFHQIEALRVDKKVSFAELKGMLAYFVEGLFGKGTKMRLRPSYFPFTEPSAEVDIACTVCHAKGCRVCKESGWVEIGGAGMVHPNVLYNCHVDPEIYTGYAFGCGLERIAMLCHRIDDVRLFTQNDIRFLRQLGYPEPA